MLATNMRLFGSHKLSHYRLSLSKMSGNIDLIKQNVFNRKANYSDPDLVQHLYEEYRAKRHDLDQARKARNDHSALMKQVITIEDDAQREKKMAEHNRVGKCMKKDVHSKEKHIELIESQLV